MRFIRTGWQHSHFAELARGFPTGAKHWQSESDHLTHSTLLGLNGSRRIACLDDHRAHALSPHKADIPPLELTNSLRFGRHSTDVQPLIVGAEIGGRFTHVRDGFEMASPPFSSGIFGLVKGTDGARCRSLLREATELYVSEPVHTRSEAAMYEELAAQLLKVTTLQDRIRIATLLADYEAVPASVMRALLHDIFPVSSVMLEKAKSISESQLLALVATTSPSRLEMIAARKNLQPAVVEALLVRMRPESLPALAANSSITLPPSVARHLVDNARDNPRLARLLAERMDDIQDTDLIEVFLDLDARGRRRVIQALEIAALREFAARRPLPRVPLPDQEKVGTLARACLQRNTDAMSRILADLTGLDIPFLVRLLADAGGEPLSICLKAAGLDSGIATRVILFSGVDDTRNYFDVKRLVDLYEMVSLRSALLLVDRWRGAPSAVTRPSGYVPQTQAGTPVRTTGSGTGRGEKPVEMPQTKRDRA